jgi:hypothetical protein
MSNDSLSVNCWGATAWHFLHSVAMGYPETLSNSPDDLLIKQNYKQFFESLEFILPCEWCKIHFKQNIQTLPIDGYLDSRYNLSLWLYDFHNLVNDATNVPDSKRPSFKSVYEQYDSFRAPCDQDSKTCGVGDDQCHIVIMDANSKFSSHDNVFKQYWPLILIIVIILFIIIMLCNKKVKK